jgi:hypothetical protein
MGAEVISENEVIIEWTKVNSAETYTFEYVAKSDVHAGLSKEQYFDNPAVATETFSIEATSSAITSNYSGYLFYHITGLLEIGAEYFIRMNASNSESSEPSKWSNIGTFILGTKSTAPTTWSSATVGVVGDSLPLKLYWIHNSEDGSIETYANIRLVIDDVEEKTITVKKSTDVKEKYETSFYELNMDNYSEGSKIEWQVQTAGILMEYGEPAFGEWSTTRVINIYAPPTLSMNLYDYENNPLERVLNAYAITSFPFNIKLSSGNYTNQKPTGYYISIISNQDYKTVDEVGNTKTIVTGTKIYSQYVDTDSINETVTISANDINLVNNMEYIIEATVSMSSGLTADYMTYAKVRWSVVEVMPFAEISVDKEVLTATIYPYVTDTEENVLLSVYRREFDGSFTEIMTEITNNSAVVDPHPSLDYARYRIVAINQRTGAVNYNDVPGVPIKEKAIIIQWDEEWRSFDVTNTATPEQPSYSGSMLKLPYNIDVTNANTPDVSLIRYIGRKRPVSYYGTHLGETATWNTEIPKYDKDTLYAIRRLSTYMGNVYVREPSGSGYWASITISFSQTHLGLTIPITINITPVEGGM